MYERILNNTKKYFSKVKRNTDELKDKMHQLFQDNIAEYEKFANWYDTSKPIINIIGKAEYEHYLIEDFKKSVYGDSYEIKKFKWCGNEL